jgi:hypothetical protein
MKLTYHDATRCFQINGVHGNKVLSHLKSKLQATVDASWGAKKDQGKMVGYSSPAHWLNGRDIYPDEFIFAAKARVNKVPVRSVLVRERQATNGKCRHCGETETLAHVLNHCPHNMAYIRERHERVLRRLGQALTRAHPGIDVLIERGPQNLGVPWIGPQYMPDIQMVDKGNRQVAILDLAVAAVDRHNDSLLKAKVHKECKYSPLANHYRRAGYRVETHGIVFGNTGEHDGSPSRILEGLGLVPRYVRNMLRWIQLDLVCSSKRIWCYHKTR